MGQYPSHGDCKAWVIFVCHFSCEIFHVGNIVEHIFEEILNIFLVCVWMITRDTLSEDGRHLSKVLARGVPPFFSSLFSSINGTVTFIRYPLVFRSCKLRAVVHVE